MPSETVVFRGYILPHSVSGCSGSTYFIPVSVRRLYAFTNTLRPKDDLRILGIVYPSSMLLRRRYDVLTRLNEEFFSGECPVNA